MARRGWRGVKNIIITGIPRAGTSLAAAILDQTADCFCLSEPEEHVEIMRSAASAQDFVDRLEKSFESLRAALIGGDSVCDRRSEDGRPVTNYFAPKTAAGVRESAFSMQWVAKAGLTQDFILGVKHNALYSAVLPEIGKRAGFGIVAIVRDPVEVIASWQSLTLPVSRGRLPAADRFWPEMRRLTESDVELLDKQLLIYELMCDRFLHVRNARIVRYEEMVLRPEVVLEAAEIAPHRFLGSVKIERPHAPPQPVILGRLDVLSRAGRLPATGIIYPRSRVAAERTRIA